MTEVTITNGYRLPTVEAMPPKKLQLARAEAARINRLARAQLSVIYRKEIDAALACRKEGGSNAAH